MIIPHMLHEQLHVPSKWVLTSAVQDTVVTIEVGMRVPVVNMALPGLVITIRLIIFLGIA
jgi:hypothetical protein